MSTNETTTAPAIVAVRTDIYITVRDMDETGNGDGGRFFLNQHYAATGLGADWGDHTYAHRRQARRAAKALAIKNNMLYRQDKEYSNYITAEQIVRADVAVSV